MRQRFRSSTRCCQRPRSGRGDVGHDLGSSDGRIPFRAAKKYGVQGVSDRVGFRQGGLFEADINDATVATLYLLPGANLKVRSKLFRELEREARVVSHDFPWRSGPRFDEGIREHVVLPVADSGKDA